MLSRLALLFVLTFTLAAPAGADEGDFVVIVNVANPAAKFSRADVENMFLRRKTTWEDGEKIHPIDLPATHPARSKFSAEVLKKSPDELKRYWQQQIFAGREQPPTEARSVAEVLRNIEFSKDAIGYVPASTKVQLFKGIKIVPVE
jgi:hypothetical protein